MKKNLFFVAAAALMLASCSNDVKIDENTVPVGSNQQQEISLTAYGTPAKRMVKRLPVQGGTFPATNTMEVKAYQTTPTAGAYFDKCTFSRRGETTTWGDNTNPKYWPMSAAKINFFAVSGAGVDNADITIADLLASATVKFDATADNNNSETAYSTATQSDIMYAFGRGAVTQSGNTLTFPTNVDMTFKHALALINFQIKAGDANSTAISIKKIELNGARYTGELLITNTNAATENDTWSAKVDWTPNAVVNSVVVPNIGDTEDPVALTASYVPDNSDTEEPTDWASLMIIPSNQTGAEPAAYGFTTFTIYYQLGGKDYTYTYAPAGYTADTPNLTAVQAGMKYTYQISMTVHEILVAPTVTVWDEQNSGDNVNI